MFLEVDPYKLPHFFGSLAVTPPHFFSVVDFGVYILWVPTILGGPFSNLAVLCDWSYVIICLDQSGNCAIPGGVSLRAAAGFL